MPTAAKPSPTRAKVILKQIRIANDLLTQRPAVSDGLWYAAKAAKEKLQQEHQDLCCMACGYYKKGQGENEHEECTC